MESATKTAIRARLNQMNSGGDLIFSTYQDWKNRDHVYFYAAPLRSTGNGWGRNNQAVLMDAANAEEGLKEIGAFVFGCYRVDSKIHCLSALFDAAGIGNFVPFQSSPNEAVIKVENFLLNAYFRSDDE